MKLVVRLGTVTHKLELPEPLLDGVVFDMKLDGKPVRGIWRASAWSLALVDQLGVERNVQLRGARLSRFEGEDETKLESDVHVGGGRMAKLRATIVPDLPTQRQAAAGSAGARVIRSQITGKVLKVMVKAGDTVAAGDTLLVVEAMKMENRVFAPAPGKVSAVSVKDGDSVATGKELLRMDHS
jgi:biotin carboxyl carrier protein